MLNKFQASSSKSDLKSFKAHLDGDAKQEIEKYVSAIQYSYDINVNAYLNSAENGIISSNLSTTFADVITEYGKQHMMDLTGEKGVRYGILNMMFGPNSMYVSNNFWSEMLDNRELLQSQYELVGSGSKWATNYDEIMIVLNEDNEISDYTLFGLGLLDRSRLETLLDDYVNNRESAQIDKSFEYSNLLGLEYKYILEADFYEDEDSDGIYTDIRKLKTTNPVEYQSKIDALYASNKAIPLKVAGIIKPKSGASALSIKTSVVYSSGLTKKIIEQSNSHDLIVEQKEKADFDIILNKPFEAGASLERNLKALGYAEIDDPSAIYLYPINFEAKKGIEKVIDDYNSMQINAGNEDRIITYTDAIGTMMSSISTIISAVSYVLIAFVSISLIVSSIMIGIITYISVLERIKEIGVLRSLGASKKDIKRVFVSESVIIGFMAGVLGILVTLILNIPINIIINSLAGLSNIAQLPIVGGFALVAISILLTFIAGLIPARIASKKDPVIALRTE